jgi:uncharacterized membrane protein
MDANATHADGSTPLSVDRLASLSDTMFGVAMTLVVTTLLPSIQAHKASALSTLSEMSGELVTVVLSFAISARYWITHHQRLAMTRSPSGREVWLNLVFLFLIVLIPISTSLPGLVGPSTESDSVVIYGAHLALMALVNLLLWVEIHRRAAAHEQIVRSAIAFALFALAAPIGALWPRVAVYLWLAVLIAPRGSRFIARKLFGE